MQHWTSYRLELLSYLSRPGIISGLVSQALWRGEGGCPGRVGEEGIMAEVGDLHQALLGGPQEVAQLNVVVDYLLVVY